MDAREKGLDPGAGGGRLTGDGHDLVACSPECGGKDGADTTGADHPDTGARALHHLGLSFQSLRVPDGVLMCVRFKGTHGPSAAEPHRQVGSVTGIPARRPPVTWLA